MRDIISDESPSKSGFKKREEEKKTVRKYHHINYYVGSVASMSNSSCLLTVPI